MLANQYDIFGDDAQMKQATILTLLAAFLSLLAVSAIVIIVVRAPGTSDQLTLIGAIVAFLAPLITSVVALLRAETANGTAKTAITAVQDHESNTTAIPPVDPLP